MSRRLQIEMEVDLMESLADDAVEERELMDEVCRSVNRVSSVFTVNSITIRGIDPVTGEVTRRG